MIIRRDAFKVYCVRGGGDCSDPQMVGSFGRYMQAESFIKAKLLRCHDGEAAKSIEGSHFHYWIESPQITASVRKAVERLYRSRTE